MAQLLVLGANPKRRSRKKTAKRAKSRHRSAAQKAATARMLAARFGSNPAKRRSRRKASPVAKRKSRRRSSGSSLSIRSFTGGAMPLLKNGVIGGAGAVANDVAFGFAAKVLPAGWISPVDASGGTNFLYFAAKAATAVAVGTFGRKLPVVGRYAPQMAEGALAVLSYQLLRPMVGAALPMAAYNPVPVMAARRNLSGMAAYLPRGQQSAQMGAYLNTNVRQLQPAGPGARVAQVINR